MSLLNIVSRIEEERHLNRTLLSSLLEKLDADIARIEEQKANLVEEFQERDASLARLIDGEAKPEPAPAPIPASDSGEELAA
jgi:hypothetical protein